ncbi:MAG: flagellar filament outer layer protein FlaA [Treponema sp.]|nr:flagellar filament outer layer protein FlaA [Treponema sp.]
MKRFIIFALFLILAAGMVFAQQAVGDPDPYMIGIDSAQQSLKEVSIEKFEQEGFWHAFMSTDEGYATARLFYGSPAGKEPIPEEEGMDIPDEKVLGVRVDFLRRGYNSFTIRPVRPIPIEGITKTISIWVVGRNFNHELKLLIQDYFGRNYELSVTGGDGKLKFQGWKKLVFAIPPQTADGQGVIQRSFHYNNQMGLKVVGFRVICDPLECLGSYYIYFDDMRAVTDLFAEENRDADDMSDGW